MKTIITPAQDNYIYDLSFGIASREQEFGSPEFDKLQENVYRELFYDLTGEEI